jgi:predicted lysophospholipase L1 biosynthesis ABC-type transport system permease subunit
VVVVDQTLAKRDYPGQDPIGRFVMWNGVRWEIVGIVGGIRSSSVADDPLPELYAPSAQLPLRTQYVELSTLLPPAQLLPEVRRELRRVDPTVALTDVATLDARLHDSLAPSRFRASLLGALGALALVLSLTGIYGVVAYAVSRQTREIGIRMALGESANHVRLRIVLAAIRLGALGAVVGLALALVGARWLGSFLSGVSPSDPRVLAASVGLAIAIVIAAAYAPARRASRTDPMLAIRAE